MNSTPFLGRKKTLDQLKRLLKKNTASLVVVRGRRRIGKSRLIYEFAKPCRFFSFTGLPPTEKIDAQMQRSEFARQLQEQLGLPGLKGEDWGDLFTLLAKQANRIQGPLVILLDEISWMGSADPTFLGKLKIAWDLHFSANPNLILVLCGSVSSWIEKNIVSSTGFFGRISQKIILEELSLLHCSQMLKAIGFQGSSIEKLMLLAITGGVPWCIENLHPNYSAVENIKQLCFEKGGILFDEFGKIAPDLFGKKSDRSQQIARHLAEGPATYQEIASALNYPSGGPLSDYLNNLILSGYAKKDLSWSIKTGKEQHLFRYRLNDNYLRFYLKCIEPYAHRIEQGRFAEQSLISLPGWHTMMGYQFENLVLHNRELILKRLKLDPSDIVYDNPFFQRKGTKQQGCQIDYLIQSRYHVLYVCEIKFSLKPLPCHVVAEVEEKIKRLKRPKGFSCLPVLIHVSGCTEALEKRGYFVESIDFNEFLD